MSTRVADPVTWFEVHTPDPVRSQAFYGGMFGWTFSEEAPGYHMVGMGENAPIGGGITSRGGDQPPMVVFNVEVGDVAAACRRVEELGGTVAMPLQETPNGLRFAYLADPDGSTFGVWTPPAN